jgi:hypothetical protein
MLSGANRLTVAFIRCTKCTGMLDSMSSSDEQTQWVDAADIMSALTLSDELIRRRFRRVDDTADDVEGISSSSSDNERISSSSGLYGKIL